MIWLAAGAGFVLLSAPFAKAQTSAWKSDPVRSDVNFTIRHLSLSDVHGRFDGVDAVIHYDEADVSKSTVMASIPVDTVSTGESGRDDVIKSSDFFDVDQFPRASFTSTAISRDGDGLWIKGNLSLHGITRAVVLKSSGPDKPVVGSDGKSHSGFLATATLDRTAFNIGSAFPAAIVGDQVQLVIRLNIVKE